MHNNLREGNLIMQKIKWGVIGAGGIADRRTIPGMLLAENAELIAVMEITKELADKIAKKYNVPYSYDNVDEMLANPDIDAVYIATPVTAHYEQATKSAMAHKHILIEKPVGLTVQEGVELDALCKKQGVLFAAGLMMRYHAYHVKAKELVTAGTLGEIVSMRAQLTCWYPDMPDNWRQSLASSGGGALMDMGVHCIDLLQYISGSNVNRVCGMTATKTFSYEVEDSASVLMEFDNGAYGYVDANFNIPDNAAHCQLEIYGTKGSILATGTIGQVEGGSFTLTVSEDTGYDAAQDRNNNSAVNVDVTLGNMYTKEISSFSDSILTGTPVAIPAAQALQVQTIIEGAYKSSREKCFVDVVAPV